jgi:hypothetical protein
MVDSKFAVGFNCRRCWWKVAGGETGGWGVYKENGGWIVVLKLQEDVEDWRSLLVLTAIVND